MITALRRLPSLAGFLLAACAHRPSIPNGELVLNAERPIVDVSISGVPLRLLVDLNEQGNVSLKSAAAAKLPVSWEEDEGVDVGRIRVRSHVASTELKIGGRTAQVQVANYERDCCVDADGSIGPNLLPYASVRWQRTTTSASNGNIVVPITISDETGLSAPSIGAGVSIRFALTAENTIATAAAGAVLARTWHGHWLGSEQRLAIAFGIRRPVRLMTFSKMGLLAGFAFDRLLIRTSDFEGDEKLPEDPVNSGDVVVSHKLPRQRKWTAVTLGRDRLSRCTDIRYDAVSRSLTLRCAFDRP